MNKILPYLGLFSEKISLIFKFLNSHNFSLRFNTKLQLSKRSFYSLATAVDIILIGLIVANGASPAQRLFEPVISPLTPLHPLTQNQSRVDCCNSQTSKEVFGFAPYWTIDKLNNVDFDTLTTLAYFGVPLLANGDLDRQDPGYQTFKSRRASAVFKKAHSHGTRVVLTVTQMNNDPILALMDSLDAQQNAISQIVAEVQDRGIDGVNIDLEYGGDPGDQYRSRFSDFVANLTEQMHSLNPNSKVTVSVYASAVKEPKIYDIASLSAGSDGIFMMAYDFAVAGSKNAIPTSPLYGHQNGQYWYDVSTAVEDFLSQMPAGKLILGVPYYGYNYPVYEPNVKAQTRPAYSWRGGSTAQTYSIAKDNVYPEMEGVLDYTSGWDEDGQVGWRAYYAEATDSWRMVFLEDVRSLSLKYDFAKQKQLGGVGIWALGFDEGKDELWSLLREKFGTKVADNSLIQRAIASDENY